MKCLGRTKRLQRCKNPARTLVCKKHWYQPWTAALFVLGILGLLAGLYQDLLAPVWNQYFNKDTEQLSVDESRPYVFFKIARLKTELKENEKPIIEFVLVNTGEIEAFCEIGDITYYFDVEPASENLEYLGENYNKVSIAPSQEYGGEFRPEFLVTTEKLSAIKSGHAKLYFYSKGSYTDKSGRSYDLEICWIYDEEFSSRLALCSGHVTIK